MDRTLDDIQGRYVVVPPDEGVSLAEIHKRVYPAMDYAPEAPRRRALFVVRPLGRDDAEGPEDSGSYNRGIAFDDLLRSVNSDADPDVWTSAGSAPSWHMDTSAPSRTEGFGEMRVFAPTLPGAPPAERQGTTVPFADMVRPIDPAAVPDIWMDRREVERTDEWSPAGADESQPWTFNTPHGAFDPRSAATMSAPWAPPAGSAPVEPGPTERIAALSQLLPNFSRGETDFEKLERIARRPGVALMSRSVMETLQPRLDRLPPGWTSTAEMWASPEAPSDRYNRNVTEALLAAGVPTRVAEWLGPKLGSLAQMGPVGLLTSAEDAIFHGGRGELLPMTMAAVSAGPGGKIAGKVVGRVAKALPMDEPARMARADKMNMTPGFWRGERSGQAPSEYPGGGYFSRDKDYADGFARKGGLPEAREFRLDLRNAYKDYEPLTAAAYSRLVDAVAAQHPKLAADMVEQLAPGRDAKWLAEFARRFPEQHVTAPGHTALTRRAIEKQAPNPIKVFRDAGYDALDSGRDVRKIAPTGIRHKDAAFDPAKWDSRNIFATIGGAAVVPGLAASASETNPSR